MKTVGKQLLDARTAKGWSPELAARETKIRLDRLKELEEDDYSNFSSPTYARGFVRTYARALGLDEYRILRQLDNKLPEDDNATFVNDTGIPYMPEPSQVAKPFELTRGVYVAGGIGVAVLFFIGFILVEAYRADLFTSAPPAPVALPVTETNALPVVPDSQTARAVPADSNMAPVALPVDQAALATQPAPVAAPVTNAPPRALPVDLNAPNSTTASTVQLATAPGAPTVIPAVNPTNAPAVTAIPAPVPTNTATPPRALPVDLNALNASDATNAPAVPLAPIAPVAPPAAVVTPAPSPIVETAPTPAPAPVAHALSARDSNSRPTQAHAAADKATQDLIAATANSPVVLPSNAPVADATPAVQPSPDLGSAAPATGPVVLPQTSASAAPAAGSEKGHGKRLVLTASHDSFVRVVSLDGSNNGQTLFSRTLKSGESVSFNDHKYSINVGDPSAVDIALDGINYGPHSENSSPDTFTVESHTP